MYSKISAMLPDNPFWKYFLLVCSIPHPSGHEEKLREALLQEAQKHHLQCRVDSAGNLAIDREAAPGCENYPSIILQAHLDMVPQAAPGVEFDFLSDAIEPMIEGDWVTTGGRTTLGADDGMGIALAMELLTDPDLRCGKLRALFTVCEETGLGGAENIEKDFLDADVLINLDSDQPFIIGCAGGSSFIGQAELASETPQSDLQPVKITLQGMHGGHSGVDIHLNVGSACKVMGDFLQKFPLLAIESVNAGTLHNAIARFANVTAVIAPDEFDALQKEAQDYSCKLNKELIPSPGEEIKLSVEKLPAMPEKILTATAQQQLLALWNALPHGVLKTTADGSSETSSNLAVIAGKAGSLWQFTLLVRSLYDQQRCKVTDQTLELMRQYGFSAEVYSAYSSWEPKWDSKFLTFACNIYRELTGKEAQKMVIHGGLEPGLFCGMNPDLQMISFAPDTQAAHSPQEKLSISDSENTRTLLRSLVEKVYLM